jgi:hypothetical protein
MRKFTPRKNVRENYNFPKNSEENSTENDFPRKKMTEKLAPALLYCQAAVLNEEV